MALMILSHGVKGLLSFQQIPPWGLVPIHLLTKFSSSLFIVVFGTSLAVAFLPAVGTPDWPRKRLQLLKRGLVVFFWYKALTIVEMFHLYSREDILKTLLYQAFPVYVEILGFYALALLWIPFILPVWQKLPLFVKPLVPIAFAVLSFQLFHHFDFWGNETLKALLVEHDRHYTWGQLARAPLIFLGLMIGEGVTHFASRPRARALFSGGLSLVGLAMIAIFLVLQKANLNESFLALALNEGKHPPATGFLLFSVGGALTLLGSCLLGGHILSVVLKPFTVIGQHSLSAFIFHIFVIFVFYRYLFDFWKKIEYERALLLTLILMALTVIWVKAASWAEKRPAS